MPLDCSFCRSRPPPISRCWRPSARGRRAAFRHVPAGNGWASPFSCCRWRSARRFRSTCPSTGWPSIAFVDGTSLGVIGGAIVGFVVLELAVVRVAPCRAYVRVHVADVPPDPPRPAAGRHPGCIAVPSARNGRLHRDPACRHGDRARSRPARGCDHGVPARVRRIVPALERAHAAVGGLRRPASANRIACTTARACTTTISATLPPWDILFGTFRNPKQFLGECGFEDGPDRRLGAMLAFDDVNAPALRAGQPRRASRRGESARAGRVLELDGGRRHSC